MVNITVPVDVPEATAVAAPEPAVDILDPSPPKADPLLLHMPVDVRSMSLFVLAALASIFALRWAAPVFIPLMLSVVLTYALSPLISWLERRKISRWISSAVILLGLAGAVGAGGYALAGSATELLDALPVAAQKLRETLHSDGTSNTRALDAVQQAAAQLEQVGLDGAGKTAAPPKGVLRVAVERPHFNVRDYLLTGTLGLLNAAGQFTLIGFLTYFALGSGTTFRRKLVKISGASLQKKKITVHVLEDIRTNIERYLMVQILVSILVGVATSITFWAIGMDNAIVWGVVAMVTNFVPYAGSVAMMGASSMLAFMQFSSVQMALLVAGSSLLIHTLVGNLLLPWLTTRTSRMGPVAVLVALIFWGWMWGVWGLLLGVPIMMVVKSVCDKVEDLQAIGELLGD